MADESRLEDLNQVFDDLFFDSVINHDCVMAYSIDNECIARVELDENGDVKAWQAIGPAATYQVQGVLAAMRYWWKVEI
jgi:hypothetical protein